MQSKLDKIKRIVRGDSKEEGNLTTSLYYLIKEIHCLPEILGREFEVIYDEQGRISKILQKPIKINSLITLLDEMKKDFDKQEREMKKVKKPRRK